MSREYQSKVKILKLRAQRAIAFAKKAGKLVQPLAQEVESRGREIEQLKWLLTQCPLMNIPGDILPHMYSQRLPRMRVYINPKSYDKLSSKQPPIQWVLTEFLPEGGMICSPNTMPGIAPLEEKK